MVLKQALWNYYILKLSGFYALLYILSDQEIKSQIIKDMLDNAFDKN